MATLSVSRPAETRPPEKSSKPMRLVLTYARNYTVPLALAIGSMILLIGAQLIIPWIVRTLVALVTEQPISSDSLRTVTTMTLIGLAVYLIKGGLQFLR